ncbi:MAG: hypothetical protein U0R50_06555 [Gaiellales bacterium]
MNGHRPHRIAYLAGHGIGPGVTAAASRALDHLRRRHGFRLEEIHPPFGAETLTNRGAELPPATRRATESADAILVAGAGETTLAALRALVRPAVRVTRTLDLGGDSTVYAPLTAEACDAAIARAATGGEPVTAVGLDDAWHARVRAIAPDAVELSLAEALELLASGSAGTVVAAPELGEALAAAPRLGGRARLVATADLPLVGPGIFTPTLTGEHVDGGHDVADPTEMLLATALLLIEGLDEREAGRALERSVADALARRSSRTAGGTIVRETTREFVDVVLELIPGTRRETDVALEVTGMGVPG